MCDALFGIFYVAEPTDTVKMNPATSIPGWHAPLLKLTEAFIQAYRDNTHVLHRFVDDLSLQIQERLDTGAASTVILTDIADRFDRAPRGATLKTLQTFGVPTGTPFASYPTSFRVVAVKLLTMVAP